MNPIIIYIIFFISRIVQLALETFRTVLTARDEKIFNTILCFAQSIIGTLNVAYVVSAIGKGEIIPPIIYVVASFAGAYIGMALDDKMALGRNILTVITSDECGKDMAKNLRDKKYAVTVMDGEGYKNKKNILLIAVDRKKEKNLIKNILEEDKAAVIIKETVSTVGGYF